MDHAAIAQCLEMSFADTPFPAVVQRLGAAGVRTYQVDLMSRRATYYDGGAATKDSVLPLADPPHVADAFSAAEVAATVKAIQAGKLGYAEFLRQLMRAGCAGYCCYIAGRKVVYLGRDGTTHVEAFPQART